MDEELHQIRLQLAEERRRRIAAEERARSERFEREEEQRWRVQAEERARSERSEREEEQRKREEEQHRREHVEIVAAAALNQQLATFLTACHGLSRLIKPVDDLSSATTGSTTKQTGRLYPQVILPWSDFPVRQRAVWQRLARTESVWTSPVYPSATNLEYLRTMIEPIGSEEELRFLDRLLVEDMVKKMFEQIPHHDELGEGLRTRGEVTFENQARFRGAEVMAAIDGMSLSSDQASRPRNTRADHFCVLRNKDGIARPVVAIEYKAPHKLTIREICTGLQGEIRPEVDIMDKDDSDFGFLCRYLMAAVLTQLFSYMIDKGVRYGYVSTGEVYVFLHIPANPTTVYYSVNVPREDFEKDGENLLERTAVSQVFAFVQQALDDEPPDQAWIASARSQLKRWKIEFVDVLKMIPETERKSRDVSAYKPSRWAPSDRTSPIWLRSRCGDDVTTARGQEGDSDDDHIDGDIGSPSTYREAKSHTATMEGAAKRTRTTKEDGQHRVRNSKGSKRSATDSQSIESRPYCTHKCLQGMCKGLPLDPLCPNHAAHGPQHIRPQAFLRLIRQQLAVDRGRNADCCALYIHGSRGAVLKVRLTSHGYTLVAKGVERCNLVHLQNETRVYERLESLQGLYVPVCCGLGSFDVPYYYDGAALTHFLLMSWAGRSLAAMERDESSVMPDPEKAFDLCKAALMAIHRQAVLHRDVEPRNMLWNQDSETLMLVDFERSVLHTRCALGELSPNRKRKRPEGSKAAIDSFTAEASAAELSMWKAFPRVLRSLRSRTET